MKNLNQNEAPGRLGGNINSFVCHKTLSAYTVATGCAVQMFDDSFRLLEAVNGSGSCSEAGDCSAVSACSAASACKTINIEQSICPHCAAANGTGGAATAGRGMVCYDMHLNAIREAERRDKPYIYQCALGLMFWVCPVFNENKFFGVLRGSGYLSSKAATQTFEAVCNGTILPEDFVRRVLAFPSCDDDKIVSLAEMLLLCAESLSDNLKSRETVRMRSEQWAAVAALVAEMNAKYSGTPDIPKYSMEKERSLIESFRKGNKEETGKLLNEVLAILIFGNTDNFPHIKYRALELAVLFSRSGTNPGGASVENYSRYLKQIQDAKTAEDITGVLHSLVENISSQIAVFQGIPHASAMMRAESFIRENFTRKISLREISKIAGLSAPYFSTIFKEEMGENLSGYINRLRVEKASRMLLETDISLGEISGACCFEDQSWFSKIFKAYTGMSPGKYRNQGGMIRKI